MEKLAEYLVKLRLRDLILKIFIKNPTYHMTKLINGKVETQIETQIIIKSHERYYPEKSLYITLINLI